MTLRFISGSNGFVPAATGQVIAFIRKESDFPLNRYIQYVPTTKVVGVYASIGRDEPVRVVTDAEFAFEDGDERPRGDYHKVPFQWVEFRTFRRDYPWTLGYQAIDQSAGGWQPRMVYAASAVSKCMTNRTKRVVAMLENTANWSGSTADANTLNSGAGKWDTASDDPTSPFYLAIFKSIVEAARRIFLATNGVVKPGDLRVLVGPGLAIKMAQSAEINNYVRETPQAVEIIKGGLDPQYALWGLPRTYRGFELVVEDSPTVGERPKASGVEATTNRTFIKADTSANVISRPGGIDGEYGAPSFSTIQIYHYGGLLAVKAFDDPRNERVDGHVEENIKEVVAASVAGFLITNTL